MTKYLNHNDNILKGTYDKSFKSSVCFASAVNEHCRGTKLLGYSNFINEYTNTVFVLEYDKDSKVFESKADAHDVLEYFLELQEAYPEFIKEIIADLEVSYNRDSHFNDDFKSSGLALAIRIQYDGAIKSPEGDLMRRKYGRPDKLYGFLLSMCRGVQERNYGRAFKNAALAHSISKEKGEDSSILKWYSYFMRGWFVSAGNHTPIVNQYKLKDLSKIGSFVYNHNQITTILDKCSRIPNDEVLSMEKTIADSKGFLRSSQTTNGTVKGSDVWIEEEEEEE